MGQRGPIPNPESTLRLRGTSRKDRQRSAPQPEVTRLDAPSWLAGEGRVMWGELGPKLRRLGLLTDLDLNSFARLCQLHGRWLAASRFIQENGATYMGPGGLEKRHPMAAVAADLERQLLALEQHFGLTPASRQRLSLDPCQQSERRDAMEDRGIFWGRS